MHGLNKEINFFIGCSLKEITADTGNIYLKFTNGISINIESAVFFGHVIAGIGGNELKKLINHKIVDAEPIGKGNLSLVFDNNEQIIIFELDMPYESYTIQTPEGLVIV